MKINSPLGPAEIAVSGMRAHARNMEVISSNIANSQTANTGDGQPYRRLEAVFRTDGTKVGGVEVDNITQDDAAPQRVYDPANPSADPTGYVSMPNVQLPVEMMNLNVASRAYQANASILKRYEKMLETALELLR